MPDGALKVEVKELAFLDLEFWNSLAACMLDTQGLQLYLINYSVRTIDALSCLMKYTFKYIDSSVSSVCSFVRLAFSDSSSVYCLQVNSPTTSKGICESMQPPAIFLRCVVDQNDSHLPVQDSPFGNL